MKSHTINSQVKMSNQQNIDPKANTKNVNCCHTHYDKSLAFDYALSHKLISQEMSSPPHESSYLFSLKVHYQRSD